MTPQKLFDHFLRLCPLGKTEGIKYKAKGPNIIEIKFPDRPGKAVFEYHNDKKWNFEFDRKA